MRRPRLSREFTRAVLGKMPRIMAQIRPFHGLRFSQAAGRIEDLVAPPYDVISESDRMQLASKSSNNVVFLTLPEQEKSDRSKFVKYGRSSARLAEWRRSGVPSRRC